MHEAEHVTSVPEFEFELSESVPNFAELGDLLFESVDAGWVETFRWVLEIKLFIKLENGLGLSIPPGNFHIEQFQYLRDKCVQLPETNQSLYFLLVVNVVPQYLVVPVYYLPVLLHQVAETGHLVLLQQLYQTDPWVLLQVLLEPPRLSQNLLSRQVDACPNAAAPVHQCQFIVPWRQPQNHVVRQVLLESVSSDALHQTHLLFHLAAQLWFVADDKLHNFLTDTQMPHDTRLVLLVQIYSFGLELVK